ncbi:unnamed protein product [Mycetohabitans rhizoxinica HKI 454]|uniref:Uncharacterized protein n=1 Tax=Mycetohabitans rhizoxinica (strain DSM 19002 / CIP 109453 / HKI 454) TaxID=882378 RepID=E5APP5_MYCRK|nr:unnamed protein product [Mycetohabitans rhizoxinica HKI 454]
MPQLQNHQAQGRRARHLQLGSASQAAPGLRPRLRFLFEEKQWLVSQGLTSPFTSTP